MGDFPGFTFCGLHSFTDLQITRVSNGSRYNETILPAFQDVTASVPGRDGQLYWEAFYSNKPHPFQIAFDGLDETHFRKLRQTFAADKEGWLIYDELPYKKYWAKAQGPVQLNYICFDDPDTGNIIRLKGFIKNKDDEWFEINATKNTINICPISLGQELFIVIGEGLNHEKIRYILKSDEKIVGTD